jgi:hypothetical protein
MNICGAGTAPPFTFNRSGSSCPLLHAALPTPLHDDCCTLAVILFAQGERKEKERKVKCAAASGQGKPQFVHCQKGSGNQRHFQSLEERIEFPDELVCSEEEE